jgi:predicted tellurium resistance membrane protein TerC
MYAKLFLAVLAFIALSLLIEGVPLFWIDAKGALPSKAHPSSYNLIFWLIIIIGLFAMLKPKRRNNP